DRRSSSGGGCPGQLEVTIRRHRPFGELDDAGILRDLLDCHAVMVALDHAERKAGIEAHRDADRIDRRVLARIEHRRLDAVTVGYWIDHIAEATVAEIDGLD